MAQVTPRFRPESRLTDVFAGFALPFRAFGLIFRTRRLFVLSTLASIVTLVALVGLVILLGTYTDDFVRTIVSDPQTWYGKVGFYVLVTLSFLLFLVVGLNTVPLLLLAPLQDPISEATEQACGEFEGQPFSVKLLARGTMVAVWHTLVRIFFLLLGHAVLLLLNVIPGFGSVAWTVSSILWTMVWLATEYLDAPMARHLYPFGEVRRAVWRRLPLALGMGAGIYLLLWVPVLNLFFIPVAIVAGTLLFRGLRACGTLDVSARAAASSPG